MLFSDRVDAGQRLSKLLEHHRQDSPVVVALPRGGVTVGFEVARALEAPLEVCVVRKIGAPDQPELGLGAVAEGGALVLDWELIGLVGASNTEVAQIAERKAEEVEQRVQLFRRGQPPISLRDRTVILVDDGIATGGTMRAAIKSIRDRGPSRLVLAVPVASDQALEAMRPLVDEVVCIESSPTLGAIGLYYDDFTQVTDHQVLLMLEHARAWPERRPGAGPPAAPG